MNSRSAPLTHGSIYKHILLLVPPMIWGIFAIVAFNLADTFFIAQLGTDELSAISFTLPITGLISYLSMGLGIGANSIISRTLGNGKTLQAKHLSFHAISLAVVIALILASTGRATIDPVFTLLNAPRDLLPKIHQYMNIWYFGLPFMFGSMSANSAIRASGNTFLPSFVMTLAALINFTLDPILIFGLSGFPKLGLQGAALATVIAYACAFISGLIILISKEQLKLKSPNPLGDFIVSCKKILHVGLPASCANIIPPIAQGIILGILAGYGREAVAGFGVATRIENLALVPMFGLAAGLSPFIGQNYAAAKLERIHSALKASIALAIFWGLGLSCFFAFSSSICIHIFNTDPNVSQSAILYLKIVPFSYLGVGIISVITASFNAIGRPSRALFITLSRSILFCIPLVLLGNYLAKEAGIFAAVALTNLLTGYIAYRTFKIKLT